MGSIPVTVKRLGTPSISIQVTRPNDPSDLTRGGPEPIIFKALFSNFAHKKKRAKYARDPQFREIHGEWDYGTSGGTFDMPERLLPAHRNANRARDQYSCRILDPGTHTVLAAATDYWGARPMALLHLRSIRIPPVTSPSWSAAPAPGRVSRRA